MRTRALLPAILAFLGTAAGAMGQNIVIRSEFWTPGLAGAREIISPEAPRNAFATFRLTMLDLPRYKFCVAANPDDAFRISVYTAQGKKLPAPCVDDLTEQTLLLDVWVPPTAPVTRIRVEAQALFNNLWIVCPMEVRVQSLTVPDKREESWRAYFCGRDPAKPAQAFTERNYRQDVAVARSLEKEIGRETVVRELLRLLGSPSEKAWCEAPSLGSGEQYLKVRRYLVSAAQGRK